MKRGTIIDGIAYLFFLLFVYAALSKLLIYPTFLEDIRRSPLIGGFAIVIGISVPLIELVTAALLAYPKKRTIGFLLSAGLMTVFTSYVAYVLNMTNDRPCSCGGLFRELKWGQHMVLNLVLMTLAFIGLLLSLKQRQSDPKDTRNQLKYT